MHSLWRSVLFVPGVRADRFSKAVEAGADAVVFDLEDSVEPRRKDEARRLVAEFLGAAAAGGSRRLIRINPSGSEWIDDDIAMVAGLRGVDGVVVPKAEDAARLAAIAHRLKPLMVVPILETAAGILRAGSLAAADPNVPAVLFGAEDLTAQLGVPRTIDGDELIVPRSTVVLAAAAAGIEAVDAVFIDINKLDDLRRDARRARAAGFRGKMAIHPSQIAVIHEVFSPTDEELAQARRIVDAYDAAVASGDAVIRLDDRMIDMPVVARARRILM